MESEFRLHHGSATTEKAAAAAGRVEAIVGDVVNGNRKAWGRIDVEDIALLVQHARDAAASPDWLSKMAIDALVTRWETAEAERDAAVARAEAAEAKWRPIAEAPRDGSRLLLWYPATRIDDGLSVEGFWDRLFDGEWMLSRGGNHIDRRVRRPTHWMPLPAGPK
jgi:hypothetical protein